MMKNSPTRTQGITLLEIILGIVIVMAGVLGVYALMSRAQSNAAVEKEQQQMEALVKGIEGQFAAAPDYSTLNTEGVRNARYEGLSVPGNSNTLNSGFNTPVVVRPAQTVVANDSFDVVYQNLGAPQCIKLIPALYAKSHNIFVGSGSTPTQSVQSTSGDTAGRLIEEGTIATACNQAAFRANQGTVVFRIYSPRNAGLATNVEACLCTPTTEDQTVACPPGQSGTITQRRNGACTGGSATCRSMEWSSWTTTSNTCSLNPNNPGTTPVTPPAATCIPTTASRNLACPAGQVGQIQESRVSTCASPTATPVWGAWSVTGNTCTPVTTPPSPCTPATQRQNLACAAGEGGQIVQERASSCASPTASPTWGPWVTIQNTCTASCVAGGSCCRPNLEDRTTQTPCAAGSYGGPIATDQRRVSSCPTATGSQVWGSWVDQRSNGTCTACPAPSQNEERTWVPRSDTNCPSGQVGTRTWEAEQRRVQDVVYNCPAGTTTLPAPSYGAWSAWTDTGNVRNQANTCVAASKCDQPAGQRSFNFARTNFAVGPNGGCPASGPSFDAGSMASTCRQPSDVGNRVAYTGYNEVWDYDGGNGTGNYVCMYTESTYEEQVCKSYCTEIKTLCGSAGASAGHCSAPAEFDYRDLPESNIVHDRSWWSGQAGPAYADGTFGGRGAYSLTSGTGYCNNYWYPWAGYTAVRASSTVVISNNGQSQTVTLACDGNTNPPNPNAGGSRQEWMCSSQQTVNVGGMSYTVQLGSNHYQAPSNSSVDVQQTCLSIE